MNWGPPAKVYTDGLKCAIVEVPLGTVTPKAVRRGARFTSLLAYEPLKSIMPENQLALFSWREMFQPFALR